MNDISWPFDNAAYEYIYRRYITMVKRRTLSLLKDSAQAEDAAQEAFVRFITHSRTHEIRHVAAYLYQIATRVVLERMRSQNRRGVTVPLEPESIGRTGWALEDKLALEKVLALVDIETANIATLYYKDGMTQDEVGQMMGIPSRTISSHLQRFCERAWRLLRDRESANDRAQESSADDLQPGKVNAV